MLRSVFNKVKMNIDFIIFWDGVMSRMKNITDMSEDLAASFSVKVCPKSGICYISPKYKYIQM
jgi:hypothetical protein